MRRVFYRFIETFFRHRFLHLVPIPILLVVFAVSYVTTKTTYGSNGTMWIERQTLLASITSNQQDNTWVTPAQTTVDEFTELLQTDAFIRAVVKGTSLESEMTKGQAVQTTLFANVRKWVWTQTLGNNIIAISAAHANAEVAQQLAAATIEAYLTWRINNDRQDSQVAQTFFTAFLDAPGWDADLNFASRCLDEVAVAVLDPFLAKLKSRRAADQPRKIRILQLLRQRTDPALLALCRELADEADAQIASAAREILERAQAGQGIEVVEIRPPGGVKLAKPGEVHVDPRTGLAFVFVPGGEFVMGSKDYTHTQPLHTVRLSPFRLGRYAVTNQEYERFLKDTKRKTLPEYWDDKKWNQPQQPVVGVSWNEAAAFCRWAGCRLSTEAEWEYACRAGSTKRFCFGDEESKLAQFAWYGKNSDGKTQPVGQRKANKWGLYDMHGNVWEWCQDWYGEYASGPATDPTGPKKGQYRVLRGGCWSDSGVYCRSAFRLSYYPSNRIIIIGFRVVLAPRSVP